VWRDGGASGYDIFFARLDADGTLLGMSQVTDDSIIDQVPHLAWTGEGYGISWFADQTLNAAFVTQTGVKTGGASPLLTPATACWLLWAGTDLTVFWLGSAAGLSFAPMSCSP